MSNNITDTGTRRSAIAIAKDGSRLKAVKLRKQNGLFEVIWTKSSEAGDLDWKAFELECGLAAESTEREKSSDGKMVVAGFDSAGVVFYRFDLPTVSEKEIAAMVKLQAETRLPLPAEQMQLAWRADQAQNGKVPVTIAAARKELLQKFVQNVSGFGPEKILLDCEAIVKTWRTFFSGNGRNAVVVSMTTHSTQVCLAQNGQLSNAVILDTGTEDLSHTIQDMLALRDPVLTDQTETIDRFIQDIRSVLELFGHAGSTELPVFVLSNDSEAHEVIVSSLKSAGLNVRAAFPQIEKLDARTRLNPADIYEYRIPIGLALTAIDGDTDRLDIFEQLYCSPSEAKSRRRLNTTKAAIAVAAVLLVLLVIVAYAVDVVSTGAIEKRLKEAGLGSAIHQLTERQKLIKSVVLQRPDLLELLNQIHTKFLFNAKLDFQSDLDKGTIPDELLQQFEENKTPLSQRATVSVEQEGTKWLITNRLKKYSIRKEGSRLKIYDTTANAGVTLDKLDFKMGRPVSITAQTRNAEEMYKFQKSLLAIKGITDVKIQNSDMDKKTKKLKFTMNFHYRNFTQKKKRTSR
jgi:Tfp pilus assembly PilM family ATPase